MTLKEILNKLSSDISMGTFVIVYTRDMMKNLLQASSIEQ